MELPLPSPRGSGSLCASGIILGGVCSTGTEEKHKKQLLGDKAFCVLICLEWGCICQQLNSRENPCWVDERPCFLLRRLASKTSSKCRH